MQAGIVDATECCEGIVILIEWKSLLCHATIWEIGIVLISQNISCSYDFYALLARSWSKYWVSTYHFRNRAILWIHFTYHFFFLMRKARNPAFGLKQATSVLLLFQIKYQSLALALHGFFSSLIQRNILEYRHWITRGIGRNAMKATRVAEVPL